MQFLTFSDLPPPTHQARPLEQKEKAQSCRETALGSDRRGRWPYSNVTRTRRTLRVTDQFLVQVLPNSLDSNSQYHDYRAVVNVHISTVPTEHTFYFLRVAMRRDAAMSLEPGPIEVVDGREVDT